MVINCMREVEINQNIKMLAVVARETEIEGEIWGISAIYTKSSV